MIQNIWCRKPRTPLARACAWLVLALCGMALQAHAQDKPADYPNRPLRLVVPFAPGSGTDLIARAFVPQWEKRLGQPIVIENRAGASGNIGTEIVARAAPDGYTLLLASNNFAINPALFKSVPYDPVKDFAPVGRVAGLPYLLVVNPSFPAKSVGEFIDVTRKQPGKFTYASAGNGTPPHIAAEVFKQMAEVDLVHIPYKGSAAALTDVVSGRVNAMFVNALSSVEYVRAGRLRALGVSTKTPIAAAPDVPTIASSGVPGYEVTLWSGIVAPAGTPDGILAYLGKELNAVLAMPDVKERLAAQGSDVTMSTPAELGELIVSELDRLAKLAKATNMKLD